MKNLAQCIIVNHVRREKVADYPCDVAYNPAKS